MKFLNRTLKPQNIIALYDGKKLTIDYKFNLEKLQKKDFKVFYFNDSLQILNLEINDEWLELEIKLEIWKYNNWPILMDECFSILSNSIQSKLVCRVNLSTGIKYYSYYNFAKLVKNQTKLRSLSIVNQSREDNKKFSLLNILLKKDSYNDYKLDHKDFDSWSFGIITSGAESEFEKLEEFVNSILEAFSGAKRTFEVIVCSDRFIDLKDLIKDTENVRLLLYSPKNTIPEIQISHKKNKITKFSKYKNLMICHNRYIMPKDWINQIENTGYQFIAQTITQPILNFKGHSKHKNIPSIAAMPSLDHYGKAILLDPYEYHPNTYINGGCIIAKKWILTKLKWNELLFWNECEDVELSRRLQDYGVILRTNSSSYLIARTPREEYFNGFRKLLDIEKLISFLFSYWPSSPVSSNSYYLLLSKIKKLLKKFLI